jgi:hypothetical protein
MLASGRLDRVTRNGEGRQFRFFRRPSGPRTKPGSRAPGGVVGCGSGDRAADIEPHLSGPNVVSAEGGGPEPTNDGGRDEIEVLGWGRNRCCRGWRHSLDRRAGVSASVAPGLGSPLRPQLLSDIRLRTGLRIHSQLSSFARQSCLFGELCQSPVPVLPRPLVVAARLCAHAPRQHPCLNG